METEETALTSRDMDRYIQNLREQERADSTVKQYASYLDAFSRWLDGHPLTKQELIGWKRELSEEYASQSINAMLAAVNGFLRFMGWGDMTVKLVKVQKALFRDEERQLHKQEYERLVRAAEERGDTRLALLLQTICATGIRVSELRFITVEAVQRGKTEVSNKGKRRVIFLPEKLRNVLRRYIQERKIESGPVFVTRTGKPLDRSNIWRAMKSLCEEATVEPGKVFPHNLRHLFAHKFYEQEKDSYRLADILGHASVNTTRIYTAENGWTHARLLDQMDMVITT